MIWLLVFLRLTVGALLGQLLVGLNSVLRTREVDYNIRCVTPAALTSGGGAGVAGSITAKLHTADPGSAGTTSEVTGGSYAPQNATFNAASAGSSALSADVPFTGMPAVTVSHVSYWDKQGTPVFLGAVALTTPQVIGTAGATFTLTAAGTTVAIN